MGAAVAEFKRSGVAAAEIAAIVSAAGVAHGTFFFHFPTKEHVLLELERREERRIANQIARFISAAIDLESVLRESINLVTGLERRLGPVLFNDFLALHFSQRRPRVDEDESHPLIDEVAAVIERSRASHTVDQSVNSVNSAIFFLLGLYALLIATDQWPTQASMIEDFLQQTLRGVGYCPTE